MYPIFIIKASMLTNFDEIYIYIYIYIYIFIYIYIYIYNDRVSKNKKSCHIWRSIKLKGVFYKYEKIEICLFTNVPLPNEFLIIRYNSWY